ncbi:MAG TPA: hypothetical protein VM118_03335 [Acidobacteriota bacterium]|nr:hypothetical protein [Acidobacteriota bacterium]
MSTDYKTITDRLKAILEANTTGALSRDLSKAVVAVKKGQYVPGSSDEKPVIYVRPEIPAHIAQMAGGQTQKRRLTYIFTGAVKADTQEEAWDDVQCLYNNLENLLMHYGADGSYWAGGRFGVNPGDDDDPERYGNWDADPGTDLCIIHFWLRWSCEIMIGREAL